MLFSGCCPVEAICWILFVGCYSMDTLRSMPSTGCYQLTDLVPWHEIGVAVTSFDSLVMVQPSDHLSPFSFPSPRAEFLAFRNSLAQITPRPS